MQGKGLPRMSLQLGTKNHLFLSPHDRTASLAGNIQREKVPVRVQADSLAVLDSHFRMHRTTNLGVIDASVFRSIPGFFIMTPGFLSQSFVVDGSTGCIS